MNKYFLQAVEYLSNFMHALYICMYVGTYVLIRLGICLSSLVMKEGKCTVHTCVQFHVHMLRMYVSLLLVEPHYLRIPK